MTTGQSVLVFTASNTFRGVKGVIVKRARGGALIQLEGEPAPMLFTDREIVSLESESHMVAGE